MAEDSTVVTKLTPSQQTAVSYWPMIAKIPIVPCDSRNKGFSHQWKNIDFSQVDWNAKLLAGEYDNGIALVLGKTLSGSPYPYSFALDFDGLDAVTAFFGSWDNVQGLSKKTRIEWHQNQGRLHIVFLSRRLVTTKRITVKDSDAAFEVRCNDLLIASPSIHGDGNAWSVLGTQEISALSDAELLKLEAKIDSLSDQEGYMSDEDKQQYIEYLHLPTTIIGEHQGRHDATKAIIINYYWKYGGGWLELDDNERFERAWEWHISHCKPARSREEFDQLCKWVVDKFKSDRDKLHKEKREEREQARRTAESGLSPGKLKLFRSYQIAIQNSISGNIWTETSYDNWIVADTTENIVYRCYAAEAGEGDSRYKVFRKAERILKCVPISITKHENPFDDDLGISTTYTITFKNTISKTYTLSNVTLDTAADWLKAEGYIMPTSSRGGSLTYTLSAMVDAYREDGKLVTERGAHFEGYYYDQGDIQVSKINLEEKHPRPSLEDCIVCANFLDERAKLNIYKYKDTEINRQADLATYIKWSIVAPFNFVIKQLTGNYLRALSFSGERDGGKTEAALEVLDIHGHRVDNGQLGGQNIYSRKVGDMNTEAKFGECVDKTTYPVLGNEFGKLESYGRGKGDERLLETARNAIESTVCRTGKKGSRYHATFMSAGSLMFTGNAVISSRGEIVKRCHAMKYSGEDRHELTDSNTVAFNNFMKANRHKYKILGDWTIRYILDNKQELLLSKKHDCYQLMNTVIEAFYKNIDRQVPEWLTKWIIDTSLEELDVDEESIIRAILFEHVNNAVRQNYQLIFSATEKEFKYCLSISEKVDRCLKNHLLSFVRPVYIKQKTVTDGKVERVVQHYEIDSSIRMLFDQRLPDITLIKIGQKMRFEHGRNGKGNVIKFTPNQLVGFLEGQSVDENAENGDG